MQFSRTTHFEHPWERVAAAHWLKYPNAKHVPHIEHVDYLERYLDATGRLHTVRLIRCTQPVPDWILRLGRLLCGVGDGSMFVQEHSVVDPRNQLLRLSTKPMGLPEYTEFEEICEYTPFSIHHTHQNVDHQNVITGDGGVCMKQSLRVSFGDGWFMGLARRVEEWCVSRFEQNAEKGKIALEDALSKIVNTTCNNGNSECNNNSIISDNVIDQACISTPE